MGACPVYDGDSYSPTSFNYCIYDFINNVFIYNSISNTWNLDYLSHNDGQYYLNVDSTNYKSYSYTNVGYYNSRFSNTISSVPLITFNNLSDYTQYVYDYSFNKGYNSAVELYTLGQLVNINNIKNISYNAQFGSFNADGVFVGSSTDTGFISVDSLEISGSNPNIVNFKNMLISSYNQSIYASTGKTCVFTHSFNLYKPLPFSTLGSITLYGCSIDLLLSNGQTLTIGGNGQNSFTYAFDNPDYADYFVSKIIFNFDYYTPNTNFNYTLSQYSDISTLVYQDGYNAGKVDGYNDGIKYLNDEIKKAYESGKNYGYTLGLQDGYNNGFTDGLNDITNNESHYNDGYNNGYQDGLSQDELDQYNEGYKKGYDLGYAHGFAETPELNLKTLFWSIGSVPFETFKSIWDFEFLGFNLTRFLTGFFMAIIIIFIIKKVMK